MAESGMSDEKRFLVVGANGLIGEAVLKELAPRCHAVGTCCQRAQAGLLTCDVTDPMRLREIFDAVRPTHVINGTGLAGGVDFCEKNPELAKKFYVGGTIELGKLCSETRARLVAVSSECVFNGEKEEYQEEDALSPLNVYGECKAETEEWMKRHLEQYMIVRTMSVFGWQPETVTPNAVMSMYFALLKKEKIQVSALRWGTPTYVRDLAKAVVELALAQENGVCHVAGSSYVNRYEWLKATCKALGWDEAYLLPQWENPPHRAARPSRVRLSTRKFRETYRTKLHSLPQALAMLREEVLSTVPE
jgi:dTDP-4-dehydrorhamnose reductase